jgi:hypothetical protein
MLFGVSVVELLVIAVFGVGGTIFWLWALIDVFTKEPDRSQRVVWAIVIALTHILGALAYVIMRRSHRHSLVRVTR